MLPALDGSRHLMSPRPPSFLTIVSLLSPRCSPVMLPFFTFSIASSRVFAPSAILMLFVALACRLCSLPRLFAVEINERGLSLPLTCASFIVWIAAAAILRTRSDKMCHLQASTLGQCAMNRFTGRSVRRMYYIGTRLFFATFLHEKQEADDDGRGPLLSKYNSEACTTQRASCSSFATVSASKRVTRNSCCGVSPHSKRWTMTSLKNRPCFMDWVVLGGAFNAVLPRHAGKHVLALRVRIGLHLRARDVIPPGASSLGSAAKLARGSSWPENPTTGNCRGD